MPPTLTDLLFTILPNDKTAISVVPPPISIIILPFGSLIGIPAPIAAALACSKRNIVLAPACSQLSLTARLSTSVIPVGIPIAILGLTKVFLLCTLFMKYLIIFSTISKSAITPSLIGFIAAIGPGTLPSILFASFPTAITFPVLFSMATTEGSANTIPSPLI